MNIAPSPITEQTIFPSWFARSIAAHALSGMYGSALSFRNFLYDHLPFLSKKISRLVISVGGIRMGGTGKTPVALMVAKHLLSKNHAVAFLSRGYGRSDSCLRVVNPNEDVDWELIGDEPWLLHNRLPETWLGIHSNRGKSAAALAERPRQAVPLLLPEHACFVLDDGFQCRAIRRDLDIVCLHDNPFNDRLVPAGNLREEAASLARAHIVLLIGQSDAIGDRCTEITRRFPHLKVFPLVQKAGRWVNARDGKTAPRPPFENPVLVCGIARPERFIAMVREAGIIPCETLVFPDHHQYITNDFNRTRELYSNGVITTEKDAVRLKKLGIVPDGTLWYLIIELSFANNVHENEFNLLIDKHFS